MRLKGKVAIITGAGSGIGRAGALRFAAEGAVVVVSDVDGEAATSTENLITEKGGSAFSLQCDASVERDNEELVERTVSTCGKLDILWANAGIPQAYAAVTSMPVDQFDRLLAVNVRGPWLAARAALEPLRQGGGGAVVFTASTSGIKARADFSGYQASKGAVVMLTRSLSREFAPFGVRVNAVCPTATATQMWGRFVETLDEDQDTAARNLASTIPLGRLATADDVANAALFLASDEASFITGINLPVDGGVLA